MLDFSPEKMLFIFLIVAVVLGPEKLPEVSRKIGRAVGELRKLSGGFRDEMNKAVNEMSADPSSTNRSTTNQSTTDQSGSGGRGEITSGAPSAGTSDESSGS